MAVEAILPDGTAQMVSYVGNFNFNWMTNYIYADDAAPAFPKGTLIHVTAWYDNTRANPNNPDPDQWVEQRSHGGRNGSCLGERHLHQRRRLRCLGSTAQIEAASGQRQECAVDSPLPRFWSPAGRCCGLKHCRWSPPTNREPVSRAHSKDGSRIPTGALTFFSATIIAIRNRKWTCPSGRRTESSF